MKNKFLEKFFVVMLLAFLLIVSGCLNTSPDNNGDIDNNNPQEETQHLEFVVITFKDANVEYDGEEHTLTVEGEPSFATVSYTNAGPFVEAGEYLITAVVKADGYKDLELSAALTITDNVEGLSFEEYNR